MQNFANDFLDKFESAWTYELRTVHVDSYFVIIHTIVKGLYDKFTKHLPCDRISGHLF